MEITHPRFLISPSVILICFSFFSFHTAARSCKTVPGSLGWPSDEEWQALNQTVTGRLLKPPPTAAVCHPEQASFDPQTCNTTDWTSSETYAQDPIGIINPNWSNDSCLPLPQLPCSGDGFPVYVINASCAEHVSAGVDFAREHDIRLNVMGSGHDYLGRSNAPNSLSIWTKHIRGIEFHDNFRPNGCEHCSGVPAVTLGGGEDWGDIYAAAHKQGLTLVGGTGDTIGLGGYLTGGGHSPLSAKMGLAADQVMQMEVVTASGEHLIANEVSNPDISWAMRGGGGATFGIMTSVTLKTFPDTPVASISVVAGAEPNSEAFWDLVTLVFSSAPQLQDLGVTGYTFISPETPYNGTKVGGLLGTLQLPDSTIAELQRALEPLQKAIAAIPGVTASYTPTQYPSLYSWYQVNKNRGAVGGNNAVGNRLLDAQALSNLTALRAAMQKATPAGTIAVQNLVSGSGVRDAVPAGGSAAVLPAWRDAYIEYAVPVSWPFLNDTAKDTQTNRLTDVYMEALRELAPDTGSYVNEGDVNEPNWQRAFWGSNYPRLFEIKRAFDPHDVFWCAVCVGSESWREEGGRLCHV